MHLVFFDSHDYLLNPDAVLPVILFPAGTKGKDEIRAGQMPIESQALKH